MAFGLKKWEQAPIEKGHSKSYKLNCVHGVAQGKKFNLKDKRTVFGRSKECQVHLNDSKVSRQHAEIVKYKQKLIITDLNSQNGVYVNHQKIKQTEIFTGDEISIGHNIFILEGDFSEGLQAAVETTVKKGFQLKTILYTICGLMLLILFLPDDGGMNLGDNDNTGDRRYDTSDINSDLIKTLRNKNRKKNKELSKKIGSILKRGLRELREGNYFRAMTEFNHALDLDPKDAQANFYLRRARELLDDVVKEYNINAIRDLESLRYRRAIQSYCSIIRLLHRYPEDKRYKDAKTKIEKLEENLGYEKGEISCL
jgi:pSer/pThr/pTyr-binding forkhead associated (FHA) protein